MSDLRVNIGVTGAQQAAQALTSVEQKLNQTAKAGSKTSDALSRLPNASGAATQSLVNLSRVAQDAPFGFIGIANNINPLLESFQSLKAQTGSTGGALKALGSQLTGPAGLGLAVGVVSSLLVVFGDKLFGAGGAAKEAESSADKLRQSIKGIFTEAGKEAAQVNSFIAVLKSETETRERKLAAIRELQKIQPEVFAGLKLEGNAVAGLDTAYKAYIENLRTVIAVKIKQAQLEQLITKQLELQGATQTESQKVLTEGTKRLQDQLISQGRQRGDAAGAGVITAITGTREKRAKELSDLDRDIQGLLRDISELSGGIELKTGEVKVKPDKIKIADPRQIVFDRIRESDVEEPLELFTNLRNQAEAFNAIIGKAPEADGFASISPQEINKINNALKETVQVGLAVGQVFSDAFGALTEALFTGQNAIKAFANAFIQSLTQVISKLIQTAILAAIVSAISGGGTAIGAASNKFGDIFKSLLGFGGGRASGGGVVGGGSYLVGENGPEIFTPQVGGRIIPNGQLNSPLMTGGGMSGGRVVIRGRELRLLGIRTQNSQIRLSGR